MVSVADAEVGQRYKCTVCGVQDMHGIKSYDVTVRLRSATHTYLKHKHGELALPNNISINLITLTPNE